MPMDGGHGALAPLPTLDTVVISSASKQSIATTRTEGWIASLGSQ
jgi:hypothetical protein